MTFDKFLNAPIRSLFDKCVAVSADNSVASCYVSTDDEQNTFMCYWNSDGGMIVYTIPEFQKAGMISCDEGMAKVGKGTMLSEVSDEVFLQIYSRIQGILSLKKEDAEQPAEQTAPTDTGSTKEEILTAFIEQLKNADEEDPVVYRYEKNPKNTVLMELEDELVRVVRYTYGEVTCIDVYKFGDENAIANLAYYEPTHVITKTLTGTEIEPYLVDKFIKILEGVEDAGR